MKRTTLGLLVGFFALFALLSITHAQDQITKPHTFSPGTTIQSSQVNENFDTVFNQVNKIGSQISVDTENGKVGIGTSEPSEKLEVNGTVKAANFVGNGSGLSGFGGIVPVGAVVAWLKSFPNTPALPANFVECNGQTLDDSGSPYNGQVVPNLNGQNQYLRGNLESGGVGNPSTDVTNLSGHAAGGNNYNHSHSVSSLSYYQVVWIIRIK